MFARRAGYGWWAALAVTVVMSGLLATQTIRLANAHAALAKHQAGAAESRAARAEAARLDSENTASKERAHAADTQSATDLRADFALGHGPDLRVRLADAERLLSESDHRAAAYRAQAAGNAAAVRRLADRAERLDRSLAEGRRLAEELRGALAGRDADVTFLLRIIRADRRLLDPDIRPMPPVSAASETPTNSTEPQP